MDLHDAMYSLPCQLEEIITQNGVLDERLCGGLPMNATLCGPESSLQRAERQLHNAAQKQNLGIQTQLVTRLRPDPVTKLKDSKLSVSFFSAQDPFTTRDALKFIHENTHCQIGADISFDITPNTRPQEERKESDKPTYHPVVTIRMFDPESPMASLVKRYLRQKLVQYCQGKLSVDQIGEIGIPAEFCTQTEALHPKFKAENNITLTFTDIASDSVIQARHRAKVIAEHISGVVDVSEASTGWNRRHTG